MKLSDGKKQAMKTREDRTVAIMVVVIIAGKVWVLGKRMPLTIAALPIAAPELQII